MNVRYRIEAAEYTSQSKAGFDEVLQHAHLSTAFFTSSKDAVLVGFRHTSTERIGTK